MFRPRRGAGVQARADVTSLARARGRRRWRDLPVGPAACTAKTDALGAGANPVAALETVARGFPVGLRFPRSEAFDFWRMTTMPNEITTADGGWRVLFAFVAHWPAAAEFLR